MRHIMVPYADRYLCQPVRSGCGNPCQDSCSGPSHPKPLGILLECGTNPQDAIFDPAQTEPETRILERVVVDTTCLFRPLVKIEFSSLVFFDVALETPQPQRSFELILTFELFRKCNGNEESLKTWTFKRIVEFIAGQGKIISDWQEETPFTVTYCDRPCPGCCTYEMRVTSTKINDSSTAIDFDAVRVTSPDISALAQGSC